MTDDASGTAAAGDGTGQGLRADLGADEVRTTAGERLLAVVLAVFLAIGLLWAYAQPLDRTDDLPQRYVVEQTEPGQPVVRSGVPELDARDAAQQRLGEAESELVSARADEVETREAYRTELDAGRSAAALRERYEQAQARRAAAERVVAAARDELARVSPAAEAVERRHAAQEDDARRDTLLLRLGFTVLVVLASLLVLDRQRRRRSRWQPMGAAAVAAATALAVVMTADHLEVDELGPVVLSLVGSAATVAAFVTYQRWLARRLPARRARRQECVFCGHPARHGRHCEGCGRPALAPCSACGEDRRVGSRHCASCGAAAA